MKYYFLLTLLLFIPLSAFKNQTKDAYASLFSNQYLQIQCVTHGTGHSGKIASIIVKNNSGSPQTFSIAPGAMMKNLDTNFQDLLILRPLVLNLNPHQILSIPLDAYCCKLKGKSPLSNNKFVLLKEIPNKNLKEFAEFFNRFNDSINTQDIQTMIWCLSDNQNPAAIPVYNENMLKYKKWICDKKNILFPWYFIKQKKFIFNDGRIHIINDSLIGSFEVISNKNGYETFIITDEKGNEVFFSQTNAVVTGKNIINIKIKITQWPKGTYYVRTKNEQNISIKKQIEV